MARITTTPPIKNCIEWPRTRAMSLNFYDRWHMQAIADRMEQMSEALAQAGAINAKNARLVAALERMKRVEAAMTAALREHVDLDHLCLMCRYYDQCEQECEDEDDKTTRFWRCKYGEEFEFQEVE